MQDHNGQLSAGGKLLAGLGAGICEAVLAVTPMETVKVKFINDQRSANPKFRGFFHGVSTIIRQEGKLLLIPISLSNASLIFLRVTCLQVSWAYTKASQPQ